MKLLILLLLGIMCIFFNTCSNIVSPVVNEGTIEQTIDYSINQLQKSLSKIPKSNYPFRTDGTGEWILTPPSEWTSGFYPGCLWFAFELSRDTSWISHADEILAGIESQQFNTSTHDLGFMIFNSFGNGYRITGNNHYKDVILQAANSLATRFNPIVGCIQSWDGEFNVIIDNMMNLELLFWASKNGGSQSYFDMAKSHAYKTIENHIRHNGSSYQVVKYNALTGEVIDKWTVGGYSVNSTWTRGQAWGIYGFTMCYRETGDIAFLNTAIKMADYFIDHLPADFIPYWDLDLPEENTKYYRDASAAAIVLSGLLELSSYMGTNSKYGVMAGNILSSLMNNYLSVGTNSNGILLHCAYNVNSNDPQDWDASTIWGDYYFLEAMKRYLKN
jgi:unsaturated chondroitin disaccharide hydrolase